MTAPVVGERKWRTLVNDGMRATREMRLALEAILKEQPSARIIGLVGQATIGLLKVKEALDELNTFEGGTHDCV
jgi:hypothetical protein